MSRQIPHIDAQTRERVGSRYAARLRGKGRLPVVVYGHGQPPMHAHVDARQLSDLLLHARAHILELRQDDQKQPVLIKDVQWDHLGSAIVHVDLERIDLTQRVTVRVEVALTGEAVGLKEEGAILEHPVTHLQIECLATQIPEKIKLDIAELKVGQTLLVRDVKLPEGVAALDDPETMICGVTVVKEVVVETAPTEAVAAEPELIGRKPEEGEEAAEGEEAKPGAKPGPKAAEKAPAEKAEKK